MADDDLSDEDNITSEKEESENSSEAQSETEINPQEAERNGEDEVDDEKEINNQGTEVDGDLEAETSDNLVSDEPELEVDIDELAESMDESETESEEAPKTQSKKKLIIICSIIISTLILVSIGTVIIFSYDRVEQGTANGIAKPRPGFLASIIIPAKKRKRMRTGLEMANQSVLAGSEKSKVLSKQKLLKSESGVNTASETVDPQLQNPSNSILKGPSPTAKVIGARMVPGKGLAMPSVTAAAYQAIPGKQKSVPVAAPDEELMESIDGKILPILSGRGKGSWQTYNYPFTPSLEKTKSADGETIIETPYPRVSIIIRGLGLNRNATLAAINKLPGAMSLAFSPYAKSMEQWASLARGAGHETLISLPMETVDFPASDPGPLSLLTDIKSEDNIARLHSIMSLSQAYVGLVQSLGSKYVTSAAALKPIIKSIKDRGLLFVDDGLVKDGLGVRLAAEMFLPHVRSDMIIDNDASEVQIRQNLIRLEKIARTNQSTIGLAKKNRTALGIGEPYPATIKQLSIWAKTLKSKKIDLAPVTAVARDQFKKLEKTSNADVKAQ